MSPVEPFVWNVVSRVRSLRGDPEGFWKSNDYHLFVCREGLLARKLDASGALRDIFGGNSADETNQILDDGRVPLVRYPWDKITQIRVRYAALGFPLLRIEGEDFKHSYSSYSSSGRDGLSSAADDIAAIMPQLIVREKTWFRFGGKLPTGQSVNWLLVIPVLTVLTAVGGLIWGFLQQPERLDHFGRFSLLLPAVWAFGLCWAICLFSGGVTRTLRLWLFTSVLISVLAGNIWGFRSFVIQQMEEQANQPVIGPDWVESIELYFSALPNSWQGEAPFLLAGLVGAWVGLKLLRSEETIDVQ